MREAVERHYPEEEGEVPKAERQGKIPPCILEELKRQEEEGEDEVDPDRRRKMPRLVQEKNATPGDCGRPVEKCMDDVRPSAVTIDRNPSACTDPVTMREKALERYGDLKVQTIF